MNDVKNRWLTGENWYDRSGFYRKVIRRQMSMERENTLYALTYLLHLLGIEPNDR